MYKLGAHLSIAGGYDKALDSIILKGGNCLQIFSSSPRAWSNANISEVGCDKFMKLRNLLKIDSVYFHACYLINCAASGEIGKKSLKSLIFELNLAGKLQIKGSIVHTGSFKDDKTETDNYIAKRDTLIYKSLISNLKSILNETPKNTLVILENAGTRKIGRKLAQLANILEDVNDMRMKVCLDTCHVHAAGYDLDSYLNFETFLDEFDSQIGIKKLEVIHLNDSRDELGSLRDRHDNIGEGKVGIQVFKNFLNNPKTKHLPFIIETPGFDKKGPDKKNLDILKSLILI